MFGQECLAEPSVDVTVQGQGEATLAEIVDRLASGESLAGCHGCTYRTPSGEVCSNPPRALQDLNAFRPHDYSLIDVERYFELQGQAPTRLHLLPGLRLSLCLLRRSFCLQPQMVATASGAHGRGDRNPLASVPFR